MHVYLLTINCWLPITSSGKIIMHVQVHQYIKTIQKGGDDGPIRATILTPVGKVWRAENMSLLQQLHFAQSILRSTQEILNLQGAWYSPDSKTRHPL